MSHPFHQILVNKDGSDLFIATAQTLKSIDLNANGSLNGEYLINNAVSEQLSTLNKKQSKPSSEIRAHIQNLLLSRNEKYLIGTTNEEKLALVFESNDINKAISHRSFPKRPSSIDTTTDDSTLILGDKFGDVYQVSLPGDDNDPITTNESEPGKGKNDPILGHVSMLVDLVIAQHDDQQYIITADRDEHIRVSRYPNSYIIERWLFAHTEFVSSLMLVPWQSTYLVSGGGDNFICLWQWTSGILVQKFNVVDFVKDYLQNVNESADHFNYQKKINKMKEEKESEKENEKENENEIEVDDTTEINPKSDSTSEIEISTNSIIAVPGLSQILVLCEGTNAIVQLDVQSNIAHAATTILPHTVVSITVDANNRLYVAYDDPNELFAIYQLNKSSPAEPILPELTKKIIEIASVPLSSGQTVSLYNMNQLRKRPEH